MVFFDAMNYKDTKWKHKRITILKRDKYTCQECYRFGKFTAAKAVHHIYPVEFYPEYRLCDWNLISLCDKCHNAMHERDTHELTAKGIALQRKVLRYKEKFDLEQTPPQDF